MKGRCERINGKNNWGTNNNLNLFLNSSVLYIEVTKQFTTRVCPGKSLKHVCVKTLYVQGSQFMALKLIK